MSQSTKRSLRVRRPPAYLSPDNEEPEYIGYARYSYMRQFVSPAQQLNQNAKLLAKFINSVNKKYIQHSKNEGSIGKTQKNEGPLVPENLQKKIDVTKQEGKKRITAKQKTKNDGHRQQKSLQDPKDHTFNKQVGKNQQNNRCKTEKVDSQKKTQDVGNNIGSLNSKYLNINSFNNENKITSFPQLQVSQMNQIATQQQQMLNSRLNRKKRPQRVEQPEPQPRLNDDKIFRKAAYHIGIAYYIHLENVKNHNQNSQNKKDFDPTIYAKKKRGNNQQGNRNSKK